MFSYLQEVYSCELQCIFQHTLYMLSIIYEEICSITLYTFANDVLGTQEHIGCTS